MAKKKRTKREREYVLLVQRQGGDFCNICRRPGDIESLVIDHINNDRTDNRIENKQLLCRSHNHSKNPRGPARHGMERQASAEIIKAEIGEPIFLHWLYEELRQNLWITKKQAKNDGAIVAGMSPETINRYLEKWTSKLGPFAYATDGRGTTVVVLKPKFRGKRKRGRQVPGMELTTEPVDT